MTQSYLARFSKAAAFPTPIHERAAEAVVDYWSAEERVQAVLLTCSCARGMAAPTSCVDLTLLVAPEDSAAFKAEELPPFWQWHRANRACQALEGAARWSGIDLDVTDGVFRPEAYYHGYTSGADMFEVEIGNTLAWTHPLLKHGSRYDALANAWLPYYDDALAEDRLASAFMFCANNLDHVAPFAERGLLMQAFQRLHHAVGEYLQALMISRRVYPIAYDKWVGEQLGDILSRPDLYKAVKGVVAVPQLTTTHLAARAERLSGMLDALEVPNA